MVIGWFQCSKKENSQRQKRAARGLRVEWEEQSGQCGGTANGYGVSFWNDKNVLEFVVMIAQFWDNIKNHLIVD